MSFRDKIQKFNDRIPIHSTVIKKNYRFHVYKTYIDPLSYNKQEILNFILENSRDTKININSPLSCWHTEFNLHQTSNKFDDLIQIINFKINEFTEEKTHKIKVNELWAAVYRTGDYAELHDHGRFSVYSGVLYLELQEGHPSIVFEDGFSPMCVQDYLYIFDSKYSHSVPKNILDHPKIILGFNFNIL